MTACFALTPLSSGFAAEYNTLEDYPLEAVAKHEHGSAITHFTVNAEGRVENCRIARSTGSTSLDEASCAIITKRGRYKPAIDRAGDPISSEGSMTVHWMFPHEPITAADLPLTSPQVIITYYPDLQSGSEGAAKPNKTTSPIPLRTIWSGLRLPASRGIQNFGYAAIVNVGTDGRVTECDLRRSSGNDKIDQAICTHLMKTVSYRAARDQDGKALEAPALVTLNYKFSS